MGRTLINFQNMATIHYLSGLPRTGSTLLSAILSQNSNIHAEGNSALCQLAWDTSVSCLIYSQQQLIASGRNEIERSLIKSVAQIYYKDTTASHIFDKCRSWTNPNNLFLVKNFLTESPKIVVLIRPVEEILKSFLYLYKKNNLDSTEFERDFFNPDSEPVMRSLDGVKYAMDNNNGEFIFIKYSELVYKPKETIESIYSFCGIEEYQHDFQEVYVKQPEDERAYDLLGLHDVRPAIEIDTKELDISISDEALQVCMRLNSSIGL
jgi:sulfotransferase